MNSKTNSSQKKYFQTENGEIDLNKIQPMMDFNYQDQNNPKLKQMKYLFEDNGLEKILINDEQNDIDFNQCINTNNQSSKQVTNQPQFSVSSQQNQQARESQINEEEKNQDNVPPRNYLEEIIRGKKQNYSDKKIINSHPTQDYIQNENSVEIQFQQYNNGYHQQIQTSNIQQQNNNLIDDPQFASFQDQFYNQNSNTNIQQVPPLDQSQEDEKQAFELSEAFIGQQQQMLELNSIQANEHYIQKILLNIQSIQDEIDKVVQSVQNSGQPLPENIINARNQLEEVMSRLQSHIQRKDSMSFANELDKLKSILGCNPEESQVILKQFEQHNNLIHNNNDNQLGNNEIISQQKQKKPTTKQIFLFKITEFFENVHLFLKNPENILKCMVLAISMIFFSSYISMPTLEGKPTEFIFDWLAYNKQSRSILLSGSLTLIAFLWFFMRQMYLILVGELTKQHYNKIKNLLFEYNPILRIAIIYMTDPTLIDNKMDLAIWVFISFVFTTLKIFNSLSCYNITVMLSNIKTECLQEVIYIRRMHNFILFLFYFNLFFCAIGFWLFWNAGIYHLSLLFYEGILLFIDGIKLAVGQQKLMRNINFYINNNTDEISEPRFKTDASFETFYNIIRLIHDLQLIKNYFNNINYKYMLHIWLVYLLSDLQDSIRSIKKGWDQYRQYKRIMNNLDQIFPRLDIGQISPDEHCSICHDELLVARKLKTCGHIFHCKCLFQWIKNQVVTKCPICRAELKEFNFSQNEGSQNYISRFFNFISNFGINGINIQLITVRQGGVNDLVNQ